MHDNYTIIPVCQIRPYGILCYSKKEYYTNRPKKHSSNFTGFLAAMGNEKREVPDTYTGELTPYSKKRLKRAIQLITAIALPKTAIAPKSGKEFTFKLNFITLTLSAPQGEFTDKQIKKEMLDVFFKRARRKWNLRSYVWRAEKQKNGNIHFHIITDIWIHYQELRDTWNDCQERLGFITKFREKNKKAYANSTDVHSIQNIKDLTAYFTKYLTKQLKEGEKIDGKLWDCSKNLKTKKNCEMIIDSEVEKFVQKVSDDQRVISKVDEHFVIFFLPAHLFTAHVKGVYLQKWNAYLSEIRNFNTS